MSTFTTRARTLANNVFTAAKPTLTRVGNAMIDNPLTTTAVVGILSYRSMKRAEQTSRRDLVQAHPTLARLLTVSAVVSTMYSTYDSLGMMRELRAMERRRNTLQEAEQLANELLEQADNLQKQVAADQAI